MRKVLGALGVLVILLLLGAAAFFALSGGGEEGGDRTSATRRDAGSSLEPVGATEDPTRMRVRSGEGAADEVEDAPVEDEPQPEVFDGQLLSVQQAGTDAPLAGVVVHITHVDGYDNDELLRDLGRALDSDITVTTDELGQARLPANDTPLIVAARTDGLAGIDYVWETHRDLDPPILNLSETSVVTVRVTTASGSPAPRVRVTAIANNDWGTQSLVSAVTDAAGIVRLYPTRDALDDEYVGNLIELIAQAPFGRRPSVTLDVSAVPEHPIELVLPASGSLVVNVVDADGNPAEDGELIGVRHASTASQHDLAWATERTVDGRVTFGAVETATSLELRDLSRNRERLTATAMVAGPPADGQHATAEFALGGPRPTVIGRVIDQHGEPVTGVTFQAAMLKPGAGFFGYSEQYEVKPNEDGRYSIRVDVDPGVHGARAMGFAQRVPMGEGSYRVNDAGTLDLPEVLVAGENPIPDLVFTSHAVLASGRVVDPFGNAVVGASVSAMQVTDRRTSSIYGMGVVKTDETGAFVLRGSVDSERITLGVSADGWFLAERPALEPGTTDATIRLTQGGGIEGSLVIPDGMRLWDLTVFISGEATRNGGDDDDFGRGVDLPMDEDGVFEHLALRPGDLTLIVCRGWDDLEGLVRVEGLTIVAGRVTRDPRIQEIDLTAVFKEIAVTVYDEKGSPIPNASVHYRALADDDDEDDESWEEAECDAQGIARVHSLANVDLLVRSPGYASKTISNVGSPVTVALLASKSTRVRLQLPKSQVPPPPFEMTAELKWRGELGGEDEEQSWFDPRNAEGSHGSFDAEGHLHIDVWDPGRYVVELMLWKTEVSSATGSDIATVPEVIEVRVTGDGAPTKIAVAVDPDVLAKRIADESGESDD